MAGFIGEIVYYDNSNHLFADGDTACDGRPRHNVQTGETDRTADDILWFAT